MFSRFFNAVAIPRRAIPVIVAGVAAIELAVANRKYGLFTGGFGMSQAVDAPGELALFAAGFAVAQLAVALLAWKLSGLLARGSPPRTVVHFAFLYAGLSLAALTAQYQLHSYFSDAVSFALLKQLGGDSATDALLFARNELALALGALGLGLLAWWLLARLAGRIAPGAPRARGLRWRMVMAAWLLFAAALAAIPRIGGDGAQGLWRILAWQGAGSLAAQATDFDRDGYGLVARTPDPHPFDPARHPLALDIPGNGVDEDGFGGDLVPVDIPRAPPAQRLAGARPHLVVVVMESTRFDVLGKRIDGRPVAPNLEALAAAGGAVVPAYSHVGFTTQSLKSLFTGQLDASRSAPSLFRELHDSGYRIGVFSGQSEDFGDISAVTGMRETATHFVDAEAMKDKRAFSFAAQGSLLIDEGVVVEEFARALGRREDWAQQQFVYLNFQSPHFPYHHDGVPHRFAHPPLARGEISAANREALARTYWNAVAHADEALGRVIARLKAVGAWEDTVLLVTGDHGEALFENGFLGHGHVIDRLQNATFLVSNRALPGIEAPIALSDYRAIALRLLGADLPPAPRHAPFMHIGPLDSPTAIGLAEATGLVTLRLDSGSACFERPRRCLPYGELAGDDRRAADRLVARWGSERWAARGR